MPPIPQNEVCHRPPGISNDSPQRPCEPPLQPATGMPISRPLKADVHGCTSCVHSARIPPVSLIARHHRKPATAIPCARFFDQFPSATRATAIGRRIADRSATCALRISAASSLRISRVAGVSAVRQSANNPRRNGLSSGRIIAEPLSADVKNIVPRHQQKDE